MIDSLKSIVTGILPPNSNGGKTFIMDPKLTGKPEVKAQIRLKFQAINGKMVMALKTFQLSNVM